MIKFCLKKNPITQNKMFINFKFRIIRVTIRMHWLPKIYQACESIIPIHLSKQ